MHISAHIRQSALLLSEVERTAKILAEIREKRIKDMDELAKMEAAMSAEKTLLDQKATKEDNERKQKIERADTMILAMENYLHRVS